MTWLLDTNAISELRKPSAHPHVVAWAAQHDADDLLVLVITLHEIEIGVLSKERTDSRQGSMLRTWFTDVVLPQFDGDLTLPIDLRVARVAARLQVPDRRPTSDLWIAATALAHPAASRHQERRRLRDRAGPVSRQPLGLRPARGFQRPPRPAPDVRGAGWGGTMPPRLWSPVRVRPPEVNSHGRAQTCRESLKAGVATHPPLTQGVDMGTSDAAGAGGDGHPPAVADPQQSRVPSPRLPVADQQPGNRTDTHAATDPAQAPSPDRPDPFETPLERFLYRTSPSHPWASSAIIAAMLALCWLAVYASGGTQRALPHLFYLPVLAAALPFGLRGVMVTGTVSAVLVGPLMPMDTATGTPQETASWVIRGVMFLLIGSISAIALRARDRMYTRRLQDDLRAALTRARLLPTAKDPALAEQVRHVLAERRFHPVFQPIYSLRTGDLVGVEALTRFDVEPYRSPDQWFAAAHEVELGIDLEIAAIEAALGHPEVHGLAVSVNVSPATLADPRLLELATSCSGRTLTLEITEHAAIEDYRLLTERMEPLRRAGVRVAVDDVGAGFSSLKHIVQIAPDVIKLDMSLTQGVNDSPLRKALATSLVEFSEHTGAVLVVEGIETDQDLAAWAAMGAHAAQGYLIGRPGDLPVSAASSVIAQMRLPR